MSFISGGDSDLQVSPNEPERDPDYVKNKVKSQNRPNRGSRARKGWRGSLAKIVKKAAQIGDLLTAEDQEENLRVIREAKLATHRIYDAEQKRLIQVPDHKTRLAAVALDLSYREGRPVEKSQSVVVHGSTEDFKQLLESIKQSPAALRGIPAEVIQEAEKVLEQSEKTESIVADQELSGLKWLRLASPPSKHS